MRETGVLRDAMVAQVSRPRDMRDSTWLDGWGVAEVFGPDGKLKQSIPFKNLCTTAGDQYYARMSGALVAPGNSGQPAAKATGMKLGTGSTAVAKSSTGSNLVTYTAGTNLIFDATYPLFAANAGTDTGWVLTYKVTWGANVPNSAQTFQEVVIVNDAATNATSSVANTFHRALFAGGLTKQTADTVSVTWGVVFLGS